MSASTAAPTKSAAKGADKEQGKFEPTAAAKGEAPAKEQRERQPREYVLLLGSPEQPLEFRVYTAEGQDKPAIFTGSHDEAKRSAIKSDQHLADAVQNQGVVMVTVPAGSWKPVTAKIKQRDPVITLGEGRPRRPRKNGEGEQPAAS